MNGDFMDRSPCEKINCVNYKNGFCTQKNPEKYAVSYTHLTLPTILLV